MSRLIVIQHINREGPGLFAQIAKSKGMEVVVYRLDLHEEMPKINEGDILLVMGGPMGICDLGNPSYPWMPKEIELLKFVLTNKLRVIGVCLGAQLLAFAAGFKVEPILNKINLKPYPEIGWSSVSFIDKNHPLNLTKNSLLDVLHWHGDRAIFPAKEKLIASNNHCKEQLFSLNPFAYGIQFHVEITESMVCNWIIEDDAFIRSALGEAGPYILRRQQKEFGLITMDQRKNFINKLFEIIS